MWVPTSVESPTRLGVRVDAGLVRIDPRGNRVSAVTPLADLDASIEHARLAVGAGSVWVEGERQGGTHGGNLPRAVIDRVDPGNGRLRATTETGGPGAAAMAAGFGALWLLRPGTGALLRVDADAT